MIAVKTKVGPIFLPSLTGEPMPAWWHDRPSDLPRRMPEFPRLADQAEALGELVEQRAFWRSVHRVLLGGVRP